MFKKILISFALAASFLTVSTLSYAQGRVGVVNTERLLAESNIARASQTKLEQEFAGRQKALEAQGQKLQGMLEAYQKDLPTLSANQKAERERLIQIEDQKFGTLRDEFQRALNQRRNEELQALLDKANAAVKQVANSEKFDLIITEAAFVKPELDITDKVLSILNK